MANPLILALDQGTTSTRAILFDAKGRALAEAGRPLEQFAKAGVAGGTQSLVYLMINHLDARITLAVTV